MVERLAAIDARVINPLKWGKHLPQSQNPHP